MSCYGVYESGRVASLLRNSRNAAIKFVFRCHSPSFVSPTYSFCCSFGCNSMSRRASSPLHALHPHSAFIKKEPTTVGSAKKNPLSFFEFLCSTPPVGDSRSPVRPAPRKQMCMVIYPFGGFPFLRSFFYASHIRTDTDETRNLYFVSS